MRTKYDYLHKYKPVHKNGFTGQFNPHIKFVYSFFDRLITRGYIQGMFDPGNVIVLLRNPGFSKHTNGVIRLMAEQLGSHIKKEAEKKGVHLTSHSIASFIAMAISI